VCVCVCAQTCIYICMYSPICKCIGLHLQCMTLGIQWEAGPTCHWEPNVRIGRRCAGESMYMYIYMCVCVCVDDYVCVFVYIDIDR